MNSTEAFIRNLQVLREVSGLSVREIANRSGISDRAIWKYLNQDSIPSLEIVDKLAGTFGISGAQLIAQDMVIDMEQAITVGTNDASNIGRLVEDYLKASPDIKRKLLRLAGDLKE